MIKVVTKTTTLRRILFLIPISLYIMHAYLQNGQGRIKKWMGTRTYDIDQILLYFHPIHFVWVSDQGCTQKKFLNPNH